LLRGNGIADEKKLREQNRQKRQFHFQKANHE
jgi:hypothetical protein